MAKSKEKSIPVKRTSTAKNPAAGNGRATNSSAAAAASDSRKTGKKRPRTFANRLVAALLCVAKVVAVVAIVSLLLAYSPGLLDIEPNQLEAPPSPRPFTGSLAPNDRLEKIEKLFRHHIVGPESIAFHDGYLYTGLHNGWIVRIKDDRTVEPIITVGDPECESWEEHKCGRPLGLRFDGKGTLYFADAYFGLYKADVRTGVATALYRSSEKINGKESKIINDLDISSSGEDIYFTDSSTKFKLQEAIYEVLENAPNGRVLHYSVKTNTTKLIVDGVAFANGMQLSADENYLLISESNRKRILKHHLRGNRKGETEVFVDNLPGLPDNIRSNGEGGYWIPMVVSSPSEAPRTIISRLGPHPIVRKVIARFIDVVRSVLKFVDKLHPLACTKTTIYKLAHMSQYVSMEPAYGLVLELDDTGNIVRSLHAPSGSITHISQVTRHGQHLYLGSPWNGFLAKLKL